jgi:hypothetical protein
MNFFKKNQERDSLLWWREKWLILAKISLNFYRNADEEHKDFFKEQSKFWISQANIYKDRLKKL